VLEGRKLPIGLPNCTRSLRYCTDISSTNCAPPTCSAARATAARSSTFVTVAQPSPSPPTSVAGVLDSSSRASLRVWSSVGSSVRVRPAASPATAKIDTPASVRAATRMRCARWPSRTYAFTPSSVQSSPARVAVVAMPASSQRPDASASASVAIVSPLAMPGRCSFFAASSPECSSVLAASTTVEKNGAQSRRRPISSRTTVSSRFV
jgi:hypothetical protein